jgi:hypothetical protein
MSTECLICSPFRLPIIHILYILTSTICWKALHSLYTIRRSRMTNISYGRDVPWRNTNLLQDQYMSSKNGIQVWYLHLTSWPILLNKSWNLCKAISMLWSSTCIACINNMHNQFGSSRQLEICNIRNRITCFSEVNLSIISSFTNNAFLR